MGHPPLADAPCIDTPVKMLCLHHDLRSQGLLASKEDSRGPAARLQLSQDALQIICTSYWPEIELSYYVAVSQAGPLTQ